MSWNDWMKRLVRGFKQPSARRADVAERRYRPHIDILEERSVPAASLRLAAMGDSLTAPYAGFPGRSDDLSWTQQIQQQHPTKVVVFNEAVAGATSDDVLFGGQAEAVRDLVAAGAVDYATLIVGANDLEAELAADLPILLGGNPTLFYQTFVVNFTTNVAENIQSTLDLVSSAGDVGLVIGNIPDVTVTPAYQGANPFILFTLHDAIVSANTQIEAIAASRQIPMIDLYALSHLSQDPLVIGRASITDLYAADGFHPNTVAQGVLANTILEALDSAYDAPVHHAMLTDQEILANAGISYRPGRPTYFDVTPFVVFEDFSAPRLPCASQNRQSEPRWHAPQGRGNRVEHAWQSAQDDHDENDIFSPRSRGRATPRRSA